MKILFIISLIFPCFIFSEVSWEGKSDLGFDVLIEQSFTSTSVDRKIQVILKATSPSGYSLNKNSLRNNLLSYYGYRPTPFILVNEEVIVVSESTQKIIFTLDPEYPGNYLLSFGVIEFLKNDGGDSVKLLSGVFPVSVIAPTDEIDYSGLIAPLMPLSVEFPVNISTENYLEYIDNTNLQKIELEKNRALFPNRGDSAIAFGILLLIKLLIAFFAFSRVFSNSKSQIPKNILHQKAFQKAISSLNTIKREDYNHDETLYVKLTDIVRSFIEEAFELQAPSLTTPEFLQRVSCHSEFDEGKQKIIKEFLIEADKVKFALKDSSSEDCKKAHLSAKTIIEKLIPLETEQYATQGISFLGTRMILQNFFKR
ncbi:MAG: hypothetical protein VX777_07200 [Chlamydiota bacterium]|nr:hypothetical protein [Chlamydiota bacterium]